MDIAIWWSLLYIIAVCIALIFVVRWVKRMLSRWKGPSNDIQL